MDAAFTCCYCGETNTIFVDPTGGTTQQYVEDCQVCCQPNVLSISWDDTTECYFVSSQPEAD